MNKRLNQSDGQRLIDEQEASGLTQKAFCARAGISVATFGYWKRKLRSDAAAQPDGVASARSVSLDDWLELAPEVPEPARGWHIELDLGNGVYLRLRQG
ncbi:MAG: IS66 family insertion sequence element accessory protein TnpA [Eubacteriales bacterium]